MPFPAARPPGCGTLGVSLRVMKESSREVRRPLLGVALAALVGIAFLVGAHVAYRGGVRSGLSGLLAAGFMFWIAVRLLRDSQRSS